MVLVLFSYQLDAAVFGKGTDCPNPAVGSSCTCHYKVCDCPDCGPGLPSSSCAQRYTDCMNRCDAQPVKSVQGTIKNGNYGIYCDCPGNVGSTYHDYIYACHKP